MANNTSILKSLASKLGNYRIRKGTEYCFKCPRCQDRKYRLEVNLHHGFNCFHCAWKGSLRDLIGDVVIAPPRATALEPVVSPKFVMPGGFTDFLTFVRAGGKIDQKFKDFAKTRGIRLKGTWGFSDSRMYWNRLIIPIREDGKNVSWVARHVCGGSPKELSPPASVANRSHYVYGLDEIPLLSRIVIVEGIFDAERLRGYGYKAVSILGSHISAIQIGKILAKRPTEVYLMFDGDQAGRQGARHAETMIKGRYSAMAWNVFRVPMVEGKDPDNLSKEEAYNLLKYVE